MTRGTRRGWPPPCSPAAHASRSLAASPDAARAACGSARSFQTGEVPSLALDPRAPHRLHSMAPADSTPSMQGGQEAAHDGRGRQVEWVLRVRRARAPVHRQAPLHQPGPAVLGMRHVDHPGGQGAVPLPVMEGRGGRTRRLAMRPTPGCSLSVGSSRQEHRERVAWGRERGVCTGRK